MYEHSSGGFCILPEWFFQEPEAIAWRDFAKKWVLEKLQNSKETFFPESSFKVEGY